MPPCPAAHSAQDTFDFLDQSSLPAPGVSSHSAAAKSPFFFVYFWCLRSGSPAGPSWLGLTSPLGELREGLGVIPARASPLGQEPCMCVKVISAELGQQPPARENSSSLDTLAHPRCQGTPAGTQRPSVGGSENQRSCQQGMCNGFGLSSSPGSSHWG